MLWTGWGLHVAAIVGQRGYSRISIVRARIACLAVAKGMAKGHLARPQPGLNMIDTGYILDIAFGFGMGICFLTLDPRNPATRMLALFFAAIAFALLVNVGYQLKVITPWTLFIAQWIGSLADMLAIVCGCEWLICIARTASERQRAMTIALLRAGEICGLLYAVLWAVRNWFHRNDPPALIIDPPQVWITNVLLILILVLAIVAAVRLMMSSPDRIERVRLLTFALAAPFLLSGLFMSGRLAFLGMGFGEGLFFAGAMRFHYLQGQRGEFLSRFLSPQVAEVVREQGLASAMQRRRVQLSAVACDLRGFTAFCESSAPEDVAQLLSEYYDAMGTAIAAFGGTISNTAGDGILVVIGAPIERENHAHLAIQMALAMHEQGDSFLARWRDLGVRIGLGIGVASGYVTVGGLGSGKRIEYVSVGPAVNLASRLCDQAENGQVLAEPRVVGLVAPHNGIKFDDLGERTLKGLAHPIKVFAASALAPAHA